MIGGLDSEISEDTGKALLESANFNFISIRKAMSKLKLKTDASTRFSRQVDPAQTVTAIQRAVHLLQEIGGAKPAGSIADCYPQPEENRSITIQNSDISRILGVDLTDEDITSALDRLGFSTETPGEGTLEISIPGFRSDISHSADIAEEIIRILGFDRLQGRLLNEPLPNQRRNDSWELRKKIRSVLTGCGLSDVLNYSLTTPEADGRLLAGAAEAPGVAHPRDRLPRDLSLLDAAMLVVASVIGAGIFFTPGQVAELLPAPGWIMAAWGAGAVLSLAGALANAELGAMYPRAGGVGSAHV